ncbi:DUF2505 domain-containing protein [Mycobacterium sp. ITM-2017-0098]|nr:DUF2505 domain-containing protein [Mycobacterium sp. ITM-2017-0098]
MSHSFDGVAKSSAAVADIHEAFGREDYWLARLATGDAVTTLDSLDARADDTVAVRYTLHLGRQLLPGAVARLVPGDLNMQYLETWTPEDRAVQGQIRVTVSGGLGSCRATTWLEPTGNGSQLRFAGQVKVKIPLVGGNLEKAIGADLAQNIPSVLDFTTTWIAERA